MCPGIEGSKVPYPSWEFLPVALPRVRAKLYFVCHMYVMQMMAGIIQICHSNSGLIIFNYLCIHSTSG
jgi:hypothetical protein